jgi:hypothetical protein
MPWLLYPEKETGCACYRRLSGYQGLSGRARKISPPSIFDPQTVQTATNRYSDWNIADAALRKYEI